MARAMHTQPHMKTSMMGLCLGLMFTVGCGGTESSELDFMELETSESEVAGFFPLRQTCFLAQRALINRRADFEACLAIAERVCNASDDIAIVGAEGGDEDSECERAVAMCADEHDALNRAYCNVGLECYNRELDGC